MARTEFGVAVASIVIVAGVLAIPLVTTPTTPAVTHVALPHPIGTPTATGSATPAASNLVGPQCAAYSKKMPTTVVGMTQDPLAVAASGNPVLTKLTAAVSGTLNPSVNLVKTLDNGEYTVFAPVDSAFAKLPTATLDSLKLPPNAKQLESILEFHVVKGELLPSNVDGILPTLEGGMLTVKGTGNNITVNGANVLCGGIQTANATVYLIDTVMMPPGTN